MFVSSLQYMTGDIYGAGEVDPFQTPNHNLVFVRLLILVCIVFVYWTFDSTGTFPKEYQLNLHSHL
jgi:hypothetical protein